MSPQIASLAIDCSLSFANFKIMSLVIDSRFNPLCKWMWTG